MNSRRDFLKRSGLAAAGLAAAGMLDPRGAGAGRASLRHAEEMPPDDVVRELLMTALDAARSGGASYSDARIFRAVVSKDLGQPEAAAADLALVPDEAVPVDMRSIVDGLRTQVGATVPGTTP